MNEVDQHLIDRIFEVRVANNIPWKRLMEIAMTHAPDETRKALAEINRNDKLVSIYLSGLLG